MSSLWPIPMLIVSRTAGETAVLLCSMNDCCSSGDIDRTENISSSIRLQANELLVTRLLSGALFRDSTSPAPPVTSIRGRQNSKLRYSYIRYLKVFKHNKGTGDTQLLQRRAFINVMLIVTDCQLVFVTDLSKYRAIELSKLQSIGLTVPLAILAISLMWEEWCIRGLKLL